MNREQNHEPPGIAGGSDADFAGCGDREWRSAASVYIKSSLTGDENDYVFHYKRRYSAFPHETTVDQMFSEEQFEAYRALGYHATFGLFDRRDDFAKLDPAEFPDASNQLELLDRLFPRKTTGGAPNQLQRFVEWFRGGHSSKPRYDAGFYAPDAYVWSAVLEDCMHLGERAR